MDPTALLALADLNFIEFNREGARSTRGGVVHEEHGLVFFVPGHRFPVGGTGVMRIEASISAADVMARAHEFFTPRKQGYTFVLMEHRDGDIVAALEASGTSRFSNSPGMAIEHRLPDAPTPAGVTFDRVLDTAGARDFGRVTGAAYATYGMPPKIAHAQFDDERMLVQPHVVAFVARLEGVPVAAAMTLVSHGVAGIYWVGTTPEARGRGLAESCTRLATNIGFDMGARAAALQASVMGEPIYRRMGYREITRYPWYVRMPEKPAK
jgi:ribosomal protein S18 acetylase RimI-like enzyme